MEGKKRTALLGLTLLALLLLAYFENNLFFLTVQRIFSNPLLAVGMVFAHNVLAVSLILLAVSFYVELVLNFMKKHRNEQVVLEHPKIFALVYTGVIFLISILRTCMLLYGAVQIEQLGLIILLSSPNGVIEAYGIYLTIKKTLRREITMKDLALIYGLFFVAAIMEVAFAQVLLTIATR